jgi:hypothetical protein
MAFEGNGNTMQLAIVCVNKTMRMARLAQGIGEQNKWISALLYSRYSFFRSTVILEFSKPSLR